MADWKCKCGCKGATYCEPCDKWECDQCHTLYPSFNCSGCSGPQPADRSFCYLCGHDRDTPAPQLEETYHRTSCSHCGKDTGLFSIDGVMRCLQCSKPLSPQPATVTLGESKLAETVREMSAAKFREAAESCSRDGIKVLWGTGGRYAIGCSCVEYNPLRCTELWINPEPDPNPEEWFDQVTREVARVHRIREGIRQMGEAI